MPTVTTAGTGVLCLAVAAATLTNCTTGSINSNTGLLTTGTYGYCTGCVANNTLGPNGICYGCPSNCSTCALTSSTGTTTVCLQCQLGYGLNDSTGVCVQCPPNCDYCDGAGVCTQCRSGTWTIGSNVAPVVANQIGNTQYSATTPPVVTQGFYLPPNQCQQCPYNCSSCANSTFCFNNCTKNYLYNSTTNQCLPNGASRIVIAGFAFLGALFYFV